MCLEKRQNGIHQAPEATATPPTRRKRKRGRGTATLVLLVSLLGVCAVAPRVAEPMIRAKLQSMLSRHFDAQLTMDDLSYEFPYGVRVYNAALVAKDHDGKDVDLVRVREVQLALAEIPWGDKPLLIERVVIDRPRVNLVVDQNGLIGRRKKPARDDDQDSMNLGGTQKLSDYFRLRRFEMNSGELALDDRRTPDKGPIVWSDIHVGIDLSRESVAVYRYSMSARNEPLMHANVRGRLDVDARTLDVDRYVVAVEARKGAAYSGLPPALRNALVSNEVEGLLTVSGVAHVPLKDPMAATHETVLDLPDGRANLASLDGSLDRVSLRVRVENQLGPNDRVRPDRRREMEDAIVAASVMGPSTDRPSVHTTLTAPAPRATSQPISVPPLALTVEKFRVESGGSSVQVWRGNGQADPQTGYWRLRDIDAQVEVGADRTALPEPIEKVVRQLNVSGSVRFTAAARGPLVKPDASHRLADMVDFEAIAYVRGVTLQPPKFPMPITGVSGTIRATPLGIRLENMEATYCDDQFYLTSARIPIDDASNLDREIRVQDIAGFMQLKGNNENYPKPLEWVAKNLHPMGLWTLTGEFAWLQDELGACADYRFDIQSQNASGALSDHRIPVTDVTCQLYASPRVVEIKSVRGKTLGGQVVVEGVVEPGKPAGYGVTAWIRNVDVRALATYFCKDGTPPSRVSGRASADVRFWGKGKTPTNSAADFVKAEGRFEIVNGSFWDAPVAEEVARETGAPTRTRAPEDEASGVFHIHDRWIHLKQVAVSSPVLGLQGDGWIGFNKQMKFNGIAAPMADWKHQMKRLRIPIISGIAGEVLGGVQGLLNVASRTMLYELRVTGTVSQPKVATVLTPMLSDGVRAMFRGTKKGHRARATAMK
jgi:hypothetical protein